MTNLETEEEIIQDYDFTNLDPVNDRALTQDASIILEQIIPQLQNEYDSYAILENVQYYIAGKQVIFRFQLHIETSGITLTLLYQINMFSKDWSKLESKLPGTPQREELEP